MVEQICSDIRDFKTQNDLDKVQYILQHYIHEKHFTYCCPELVLHFIFPHFFKIQSYMEASMIKSLHFSMKMTSEEYFEA